MKVLAHNSFQQAESFILNHARPLERALYRHHFQKGSIEKVLEELKEFQNVDGGFGHGLEPDFRLPLSSPMATTEAMQILIDVKCPKNHEIFTKAIEYLVHTYKDELLGWWITPLEVVDYAHAPWWKNALEARREHYDKHWLNPCGEIVGYLHCRKDLVPKHMLEKTTNHLLSKLDSLIQAPDGHDFLCVVRSLRLLPENLYGICFEKLSKIFDQCIETSKEKWDGYCILPHWAIESKLSPFYAQMHLIMEDNLDGIVETQQRDGSWYPIWEWGQYESEWKKVKLEWQGRLTLKNLKVLQNFDRLLERHNF